MAEWNNVDGLLIQYGPDEVAVAKAGEVLQGRGDLHEIEIDLDYTMVASATATIVNDTVTIPKNAWVERVQVVTLTAWDSAADNFVLNLGTIRATDRTTAIDADGLIAALPQASMDPAGEVQEIIIGHTYVGADVGTVVSDTYPGLICADYDTGAPTAGRSTIRIFYRFI